MGRRLTLLIGPSEHAAARFRGIFREKEEELARAGVLAPDWRHVRLYAACAEPEDVGVLRYQRGLDSPLVQRTLTVEFEKLIAADLADSPAEHVVLSVAQLGTLLSRPAELSRLRALFTPHVDDIRIVAHVDEQARALAGHYAYAVGEGRRHPLERDLALAGADSWWDDALALRHGGDPFFGLFDDVQQPPFWLDYTRLVALWEDVFGAGCVTLRPLDPAALTSARGAEEVARLLDLDTPLGAVQAASPWPAESAASLARMRQFSDVLIRLCQKREVLCPRALWQQILRTLRIDGCGIAPGSLQAVSDHFAAANAMLMQRFEGLAPALVPDAPLPPHTEADPLYGYRPTQYLAAYDDHLRKHAIPLADKQVEAAAARQAARKFDTLIGQDDTGGPEAAERAQRLRDRVKVNHRMILSGPFRPHNDLGKVDEDQPGAPYAPAPLREPAPGSSGTVIVGCMKNEAPYILEWIAYHRAIGVDSFLIYTNDCSDGTDEILGRLQDLGILQHRRNDDWTGKSPQQHALNRSLKEPLIRDATWIVHIDVDEFMNIRTGNGTLQDLFAAVPDATNFAMTWRLFGHNGITALSDGFVIEQFDTCAPKYCPKPHTVWGYKTMFRNIGAYGKISCHRPNKLAAGFEDRVTWVNGSGRDMTPDARHRGWRSSKDNVGYDLLQLNHYALRSADSFLIKRQRGRALHVDRSIGINYWIRMDWSDCRDVTIQRNLPRVRAEYDRLLQDEVLRGHHEAGLAWHRAKAAELRATPEFRDLLRQALDVKLTATERVAYALSLDMES